MRVLGKRVFSIGILGLAFMLIQMPGVNAKDKVTRPFQISAQSAFLDFPSTPLMVVDQGVASEIGRFVLVGKYLAPGSGFGIIYAANGDQIFWEEEKGVLEFRGGTGRFEHVTGGFEFSIGSFEPVEGPAGTTTLVLTYTGKGTITY